MIQFIYIILTRAGYTRFKGIGTNIRPAAKEMKLEEGKSRERGIYTGVSHHHTRR